VDAAHILPWASYDLDVVANGLCLCKLHHWAFDQQLIAVKVNGTSYEVYVTDRGRSALAGAPDSLAALEAVQGVIPVTRLPTNLADRPRKEFFNELYAELPV
jgi:putative restriction endonuclease